MSLNDLDAIAVGVFYIPVTSGAIDRGGKWPQRQFDFSAVRFNFGEDRLRVRGMQDMFGDPIAIGVRILWVRRIERRCVVQQLDDPAAQTDRPIVAVSNRMAR